MAVKQELKHTHTHGLQIKIGTCDEQPSSTLDQINQLILPPWLLNFGSSPLYRLLIKLARHLINGNK